MAWTNPRTWVSGEVITAALLNTHLRDNLLAVSGIWQNYTPTVTGGFTAGTGATLAGRYVQIGKTVTFRATWTLGTGFTIGNGVGLSLPVTGSASSMDGPAKAVMTSTGLNIWLGLPGWTTTAMTVSIIGGSGAGTAIASNNPFTWKATDILACSGTYEAA